MNSSSKVGLGFVATGLLVGFLTSALGLQHLKTPLWVGLAVLCLVTVFAMSFRHRIRKLPKSSGPTTD